MRWLMKSLFLLLLSTFNKNAMFVHGGWIDTDTPEDKRVVTSLIDGSEYHLVRYHNYHYYCNYLILK